MIHGTGSNRGVGVVATAVGTQDTGDALSLCTAYPLATVPAEDVAAIIARMLRGTKEIASLVGDPFWATRPAA